MLRKIIVTALVISAFAYGIAVGHYKVFPFEQLRNLLASQKEPFSKSDLFKTYQTLFHGLSKKYDIVFLGDSITDAGRWSEAFTKYVVANRGISGDTSEGVLNRLDTIIQTTPDTVYIMLGINDITRGDGINTIFIRYQKIVKKLLKNNITVVIQSTLLTDKENWNIKINQLNNKLINLSNDLNLTYIDLNKTFAPLGKLTPENSDDGVHLKVDSYLKWFKLIKNTLPQIH